MTRTCEVAVVGLGAVGSATLYQLARRGVRAVGIDRYAPPHDRGSSHGETRITRQAIGEGEAYVPLVLRSNAIWEEIEVHTGERLLERCGFLFITRDDAGTVHHGKAGFLKRTRAAAARFDIAHELLDSAELGRRFPQFTGLSGDETAYYEPGGGYVRPERCIAAQLALARDGGAKVLTDCDVLAVDRNGYGVQLRTSGGAVVADRVILATGSWLPRHVGARAARRISVHKQLLHWFDVIDPAAYRRGATPTFIWIHGSGARDQFYGFPPLDGAVKVAREDYSGAFDPDGERSADPVEGEAIAADHVRGRLAGLAHCPSRSEICHYAVTDDQDFIIDCDEGEARVRFVSACSGHGFKHSAAIGEALAQAAAGETSGVDLASFGLAARG